MTLILFQANVIRCLYFYPRLFFEIFSKVFRFIVYSSENYFK